MERFPDRRIAVWVQLRVQLPLLRVYNCWAFVSDITSLRKLSSTFWTMRRFVIIWYLLGSWPPLLDWCLLAVLYCGVERGKTTTQRHFIHLYNHIQETACPPTMSRMGIAAYHEPGLQVAVKVALFEVQNDEIQIGGGQVKKSAQLISESCCPKLWCSTSEPWLPGTLIFNDAPRLYYPSHHQQCKSDSWHFRSIGDT